MSSEPIISVRNLSKNFSIYASPSDRLKQYLMPWFQRMLGFKPKQYYRPFTAISDVNFVVNAGETVGIVGRNGAGKSTLLQLLCGTLTPTCGEIEVNGRVAALLELGAGFNGEYTGRENIYLNARILGLNDQEINAKFDQIIQFADIGIHLDQPVKTYSSGMYVRLGFAVIAHVDAKVLIIDEALAVGDAAFASKCLTFLRTFQQTGVVLFVTHDTSITRSLCSRALWLQSGQLVSIGNVKDVCDAYEADIRKDLFSSKQIISTSYSNEPEIRSTFLEGQINKDRIDLFACSLLVNDSSAIYFSGGEQTSIHFCFSSIVSVRSLIVGFVVRDKMGQALFGENNLGWKSAPQEATSLPSNTRVEGKFIFQMPILVKGQYSITLAISDGTQDEHEVLAWFPDAITFYSTSSKRTTGLVGIPIDNFVINSIRIED